MGVAVVVRYGAGMLSLEKGNVSSDGENDDYSKLKMERDI